MHDSWYYNKFSIFFARRDTRTLSTKSQIESFSENKRRKVVKQQAKFSRNDDEIFDDKKRRNNIKNSQQTIDETIDQIVNLLFFLRNFFLSFIHQFFIMIRNNFESDSSFRRTFNQFDKFVNDILNEFDERTNQEKSKEEIYVFKIKRRQFVFTFDNEMKIDEDDATFSLNVINIKQLQWWIQKHSHIFLIDFNILRIDRNRFLKTFNDYHDFVKNFKI